jgi:2-polyprenyl-3-methyl-5-hydroxy-6-metoxy-1,4-benzoquinol methylase
MRLAGAAESDDADPQHQARRVLKRPRARIRDGTVRLVTVDNRAGLSTFSADLNPNKVALLDTFLVPGRALELGSGAGQYGETIARRCTELLQIDLVDRRALHARSFPFFAMDAAQVRTLGRFENVVALDLLEHMPDEDEFLSAVADVCARRLILSVPNADDSQPAMMGLTHFHHTDKTHQREYSPESLEAALTAHGFRVLDIRPQYNTLWAFNAPMALARANRLSWLAAKSIWAQCRLYEAIGLFENRCVADWLCAAERVE